MAYGDFKDLARITTSDKVLVNKVFNIGKNPKYDGYQRGLASIVHNKIHKWPKNYTNQLLNNLKKKSLFFI